MLTLADAPPLEGKWPYGLALFLVAVAVTLIIAHRDRRKK